MKGKGEEVRRRREGEGRRREEGKERRGGKREEEGGREGKEGINRFITKGNTCCVGARCVACVMCQCRERWRV